MRLTEENAPAVIFGVWALFVIAIFYWACSLVPSQPNPSCPCVHYQK